MTAATIKDLFANDIFRRIEEVIKVDQDDEQVIREEISEYVVTDSIRDHFSEVFRAILGDPKETARRNRCVGVRLFWIRKIELCQVPWFGVGESKRRR